MVNCIHLFNIILRENRQKLFFYVAVCAGDIKPTMKNDTQFLTATMLVEEDIGSTLVAECVSAASS